VRNNLGRNRKRIRNRRFAIPLPQKRVMDPIFSNMNLATMHPQMVSLVFPVVPTASIAKVEMWFASPLLRMGQGEEGKHDAFACLMFCIPILESVIRLEERPPGRRRLKKKLEMVPGSAEAGMLAAFLNIPEVHAIAFWGAFRNGLSHEAMIKRRMLYRLEGNRPDGQPHAEPARMDGGTIVIYIWTLRNKVADKIRHHGDAIWPYLPEIVRLLEPSDSLDGMRRF